jgi:hypothetical protein
MGGAWRRLRDVGQGPDRFCHARIEDRDSTTSSSSTKPARRSRSRRGTASPSRNGWPTARRRAFRFSCTRSRGRRSGSIST